VPAASMALAELLEQPAASAASTVNADILLEALIGAFRSNPSGSVS
jgi:hypothetical protein